jgi:hypothetical protein
MYHSAVEKDRNWGCKDRFHAKCSCGPGGRSLKEGGESGGDKAHNLIQIETGISIILSYFMEKVNA